MIIFYQLSLAIIRLKYSFVTKWAVFRKGLRGRGTLKISGRGKVIMGDNVLIDGRGDPVIPFIHHKDVVISICSTSFVNGVRFGRQTKITIGEYAILADARILDTDFHSIYPDRWSPDAAVESKPIIIVNNVWVGGAAHILKAVKIGDNSVIGFASVVTKDVLPNCVVAGNLAWRT